MTDFRSLCSELLTDYKEHRYRSVLADRAEAALAEPIPGKPSDDDLKKLWFWHLQLSLSIEDATVGFAREVLERWGR